MQVAVDGGRLTSDVRVLVLADIERRLGIAVHLTDCVADPRSPEQVHHTLAEMIRCRVPLIAAGCPDANDCGTLCSDSAFTMAVRRLSESGQIRAASPARSAPV